MGLGRLFTRNIDYKVTDTDTGMSQTFTVVTDGVGCYPDWSYGHYQGGMSIPGAWRAAVLLSDLIGMVPWNAYRERAGGPVEKLNPTPSVLEQPNPPDPRVTTFSSWALDLVWEGNAIGVIAGRNAQGWPTAVLPVPARAVSVRRVEPWDEIPLPEGTIVYRIGTRTYSSDDVVHIKGPCAPGALRGFGVLENHLRGSLQLAADLNRQAGAVSQNGVPTGVLKSSDPDFEQDDATALKQAWLTAQSTRTIAVLNETTSFEPIAWNPTESQLIEARRFSLQELALIFGVPGWFLGVATDGMTYSNIEQEGANLVRYSLGGHLARFEQTLSLHLPRGTWAKANLDSLLRSDTLSRYQAHQIGITAGFLTDDEARALEDMPPLTAAQRALMAPPTAPAPPAPQPAPGQVPQDGQAPPGAVRVAHVSSAPHLHDYWTRDPEGLAKWATHPHPFEALLGELRKHITDEREAKATAAAWYFDVFGHAPGQHKGKGGRK